MLRLTHFRMDTARSQQSFGVRHHPALMEPRNDTSEQERLGEAVIRAIDARDIQDTVANLAEAGIDQLLDDGFLRDVPALGTVLGVIRATGSIRDLLLAKKLGRFLCELQRVPTRDREAFRRSLSSPKEQRKVGEALVLLLDRLDDLEKPPLVARVFAAYVRGQIDQPTFRLMAMAVDRLHLPHLRELISFYENGGDAAAAAKLDKDVSQALAFAGVLRAEAKGNGGGWLGAEFAGAVLTYTGNELGRQLATIVARDA